LTLPRSFDVIILPIAFFSVSEELATSFSHEDGFAFSFAKQMAIYRIGHTLSVSDQF